MAISAEIFSLAKRLCERLNPPDITGLHLPDPVVDDEFRDEFGFVILSDGTAAPFYVSLPGTLTELQARFPDPKNTNLRLQDCFSALSGSSLPDRALAIGAWNALSQHLFRRAGYRCPPRGAGGIEPRPGERIGMIGYFCPIIDRLVANDIDVLVVEQQPGRVPPRERVELSQDLRSLADCRLVYCTASTLINDTLEQVLEFCAEAAVIDLIGPSGSGLPDVLFRHGVHAVGGISFDKVDALRNALEQRESWGSVGRKYELTVDAYPGVESLLERVID